MQGYEEALEDERRLTREIDVLLNGEEGAAKQASLCDLVAQLKKHELEGGILAALSAAEAENRRLREALDTIESMSTIETGEIQRVAREALGKK